ncbi:hypothetical protein DUI87_13986 [Hirundo rustica rustica]|uniref:RNA-directed DNA polymerase n=1 Tax=Hirundo rustica rustica TaxID=333673 RepID=A0A3M0K771_HIRRU|nr:hypothetical protein DUI87_13986 [Hirundo rustica rustica]
MLSAEEADTLQTLELFAVVWAISHFREPINVVTDSLYVAGVVARIEDAFIKEVRNQRLYQLLMQLNKALHQREQPYAVIHIRSHKWNIGLGEGNQRADELVSTAITVPLPQHVLAREAHSIFHQNAKGLQKEFHISHAEATAIVRSCPICCHHNGGLGLGTGVNPRGVMANELWQTDVTHVNSFGRLKYVHVTIDTYSHYIWATPQSGERAIHVIRHLTSCFAVMGVCRKLKTDNGAAYVSSRVQTFLKQWGVKHVTGIPHNPRGQAIVERANGTLKTYIEKYSHITDIQERVAKTLFVLNYLCVFGSSKEPAVITHFDSPSENKTEPTEIWVRYKCLKTGLWQGPVKVLYWGRGYLCVSTPTGPEWIPARWTKPASKPQSGGHQESSVTPRRLGSPSSEVPVDSD